MNRKISRKKKKQQLWTRDSTMLEVFNLKWRAVEWKLFIDNVVKKQFYLYIQPTLNSTEESASVEASTPVFINITTSSDENKQVRC